jgi:FtsP/CotA-like multicopper oxidase with cupredoxin domain
MFTAPHIPPLRHWLRVTTTLVAVALLAWMIGTTGPARSAAAADESPGRTVHVELNIQEKTIPIMGMPMTAWTFNGTVPGPILRVHVGDTLEVVLNNTHNRIHSFHAHLDDYDLAYDGSSMTMPMPAMQHQTDDPMGAVGGEMPAFGDQAGPKAGMNPMGAYAPREDEDVARPGKTYTYRYAINHVGTFLYHCHVNEPKDHISKGLFGMIVAYPQGWSWQEQPPDPLNGNTKAWVTDSHGRRFYEDVLIVSTRNPVSESAKGMAAQGGVAGGPVYLGNYHAMDNPYIIGPVKTGTPMLIHVGNLGDNAYTWHPQGQHFYQLWQAWDPKSPWTTGKIDPGPFTPIVQLAHTSGVLPGQATPFLLTAGKPGFWMNHDHVIPHAQLGMMTFLHITA